MSGVKVKGGGSSASTVRVSIPKKAKEMIQNIKEITGQSHSDDEIYAMLNECNMDPNETAQKLLLLDTFQEVKRKREKKKEILKPVESKWKPGTQGRGHRSVRENYPSRNISHNAGSGRNLVVAKSSVMKSLPDNGTSKAPLTTVQEIASSVAVVPNGPSGITSHTTNSINGPIQVGEGSDCIPVKRIADNPKESKLPSAKNSTLEVVMNDFHEVGKNQHVESVSSTSGVSAVSSRPSSNHSNSSRVTGPEEVGPGKGRKLTPTNSTTNQDTESQKKLEELHISDKHVIIPIHLHVPEVEKLGFCFGSFDASFGDLSLNDVQGSDKDHPVSQSPVSIHDHVDEQQLSHQNALAAVENTETDQPQSPIQEPEICSSNEVEVLSSIIPDYNESKTDVASEALQHHVTHTSSSCNFGLMTPALNGQLTPLESSESQARDALRFPGFIVPQYFDPASYYMQFYRPGMDTDGRASSFLSAGAANKFSGNTAVMSPQTSQSPQEGGAPLVLSTATPTSLVTQPAGVTQSAVPTQQPLPLFRQPTGVHLPHHFPPNYVPYGPYISPYYIPNPAMHQFFSNPVFPQAGLYPTPTGTTVKYPIPQFKQGPTADIGVPGQYGISTANNISSSSTAVVTSTSNVDLAAPQVKENNVYNSGQQAEGQGVWFSNPSRDISTLQQATPFYNIPHAQLPFNPSHPGHGTFTGVFHPGPAPVHPLFQQSQAITSPADMVGPAASVYQQQQQHAQLNWPTNY